MHKVDHPTSASSLPAIGASQGEEGYFQEGNPSAGQAATVVTGAFLNDLIQNLEALSNAAGVTWTKGRAEDLLDTLVLNLSAIVGGSSIAGFTRANTLASLPAASTVPTGTVAFLTGSGEIRAAFGTPGSEQWVLLGSADLGWHSGNDGAGSGLDADLLDGKQGSAYLESAGASVQAAQDGFLVLPASLGGIIFQWGRTGVIATDTAQQITLPMAFPNAHYITVATTLGAGVSGAGLNNAEGVQNLQLGSFEIINDSAPDSDFTYFSVGS